MECDELNLDENTDIAGCVADALRLALDVPDWLAMLRQMTGNTVGLSTVQMRVLIHGLRR